ncbi:MAG: Holliday junction branch migration protein RuvA [bacterium (Candidatus Stahlbacteria) CG23_combo_of_CG06-09_8_20_14_all_34_7]|nr:MAG: Holliday junction branch migration protein RuvA [bacterium (Candidatus Stahlbacteria) CG23_combo_of_CG06-09_8_20_14_all_34_7]
MNSFIKGALIQKNPANVIVENNGMGYMLRISLSSYDMLPSSGENVTLYTFLSIKNEEVSIYGFSTEKEKALFLKLIEIPKVGPKTALSVFNAMTPGEFENAILIRNSSMIAKARGISKKIAETIILELSGRLSVDGMRITNDAYEALLALGFNQKDIDSVMKEVMETVEDKNDMESIVREALKRLR